MSTATEKQRRQRGEGSVYFDTTKGKWFGVVDLGYINGKRARRKVSGKTMAEAINKRKKAAREVEEGNRSTSSPTVAAWLDYWLTIKQPKIKPLSYKVYANKVKVYLVPCLGRVRLDKLEPHHVRGLHTWMEQKGLANRTIIQTQRILSSALRAAQEEGKVHRNVARIVEAPEALGETRRPLALDEVKQFLRVVQEDRLAARWLTSFLLGLRQCEVLGMTWDHLDLDRGVYLLEWQLQRVPYAHGCGAQTKEGWPCGRTTRGAMNCEKKRIPIPRDFTHKPLDGNLVLQRTKTKAMRYIPLPEPLVLALRLRHEAYLVERESWETDHGLVFTRPDGQPVEVNRDHLEWHRILQEAGIPDDTTQHASRHSTASLLFEMKVSERTIMNILGHSEIMTTHSYMHDDLTLSRIALGELADLFAPALAAPK